MPGQGWVFIRFACYFIWFGNASLTMPYPPPPNILIDAQLWSPGGTKWCDKHRQGEPCISCYHWREQVWKRHSSFIWQYSKGMWRDWCQDRRLRWRSIVWTWQQGSRIDSSMSMANSDTDTPRRKIVARPLRYGRKRNCEIWRGMQHIKRFHSLNVFYIDCRSPGSHPLGPSFWGTTS